MKKIIATIALLFSLAFSGDAISKKFDINPVYIPGSVSELSGVWQPATYPTGTFGFTLTLLAGRYYAEPLGFAAGTCGNYLGIKASLPKTNPNTSVFGYRDVYNPSGDIQFGELYHLMIPGKPGIAAGLTINSFDAPSEVLTVTLSNNTFGFNGQVQLVRVFDLQVVTPPQCSHK